MVVALAGVVQVAGELAVEESVRVAMVVVMVAELLEAVGKVED